MLYNNSHEFLSDMYQLKQIAIKSCRNNKHLEHIEIVFDRARELAQCKQPLRASVQNKHLTNAFEPIIDTANAENIPIIIDSLYECGQKYGAVMALESKRKKATSTSTTTADSEVNIVEVFVAIPAALLIDMQCMCRNVYSLKERGRPLLAVPPLTAECPLRSSPRHRQDLFLQLILLVSRQEMRVGRRVEGRCLE